MGGSRFVDTPTMGTPVEHHVAEVLPLHSLELALLARNEETYSLQDCSGQDTLVDSESGKQGAEEHLPDGLQHGSQFANRTLNESEEHLPEGLQHGSQFANRTLNESEEHLPDGLQRGSQFANRTLNESEEQPLETLDIAELAEHIGTLQVAPEKLNKCSDSTKQDGGKEGMSLLDLYYGASSTEIEQEKTNVFDYVLELYNFPPTFKTHHLLKELKPYSTEPYRLKWVDDTHALVIFCSSTEASTVAKAPFAKFNARLLGTSTHADSIAMAEKVAESMQASLVKAHAQPVNSQRPKTSASVARRMVSHALGVKVQVSPEQKKIEENDLREAKAQKRKQRLHGEQSSSTRY